MKDQGNAFNGVEKTGRYLVHKQQNLNGIRSIIRVALDSYVECFATSDGIGPIMSANGRNYLIHADFRLKYPLLTHRRKVAFKRIQLFSTTSNTGVTVLDVDNLDSTSFVDPFLKSRNGVVILHSFPDLQIECNNKPMEQLNLANPFIHSLTIGTNTSTHYTGFRIPNGIPIPTPFLSWVQGDSFNTLWTLTRWSVSGLLLPDGIRAYIVHLVRDSEHVYEGCAYCTGKLKYT
jgi:hypothetical protein